VGGTGPVGQHSRPSRSRVACAHVVSVKGEMHRSRCTGVHCAACTQQHSQSVSYLPPAPRVTTTCCGLSSTELLQFVVRARTRRGGNHPTHAQCAVERRRKPLLYAVFHSASLRSSTPTAKPPKAAGPGPWPAPQTHSRTPPTSAPMPEAHARRRARASSAPT
jgi:hypothetical protein